MELRQIFNVMIRWAWLIILSVVIAAGSSYYASRSATPLYRTKTTLMVGQATRNPETSSSDLYTGQQLAYTYSQLASREPVLKGAIQGLGLQMSWEELASQVSTNIVPQTQLLEINVIDSNPYRAKVLADAIAQQLILQSPAGSVLANADEMEFIRNQISELKDKIETGQNDLIRLHQDLDASNSALQIQDLENQIGLLETKISGWQNTYSQLLLTLQGGDVNVLNVVEEAAIPKNPISPNTPMNVLVAAAIGLTLAIGGILLIEYLDDTVKSSEDVERVTGLPTIGTIARIKGKTYPEHLIAAREPFSPIVEEFRGLRNNILYSTSEEPLRVLLFTSAGPGEGKSICLANLAVVMATMGQRVILVDSDFRRPAQSQIFNLPNDTGLSTAIQDNNIKIENLFVDIGIENLKVITSGPIPTNPNMFLESERFREIIQELRTIADIILFDSPPMMAVSDGTILGTMVDGVILVVDKGKTHADVIRVLVNEMRRIQTPLIGTILNRASQDKKRAYYYYYKNRNGHDKVDLVSSRNGNRLRSLLSSQNRESSLSKLKKSSELSLTNITNSKRTPSKTGDSFHPNQKGDSSKEITSEDVQKPMDEIIQEIRTTIHKKT